MIAVEPLVVTLVEALAATRRRAPQKGIHALRVTTRRLDTWLRLSGRGVLRDDLRWLRAAVGPARDLDVLLASPLFAAQRVDPAFAAQQKARRAEARAHAVAVASDPRAAALVAALRNLPPLHEAQARAGTRRLLRGLIDLPVDPASPDDVHRRRRALRRVRYALELLGRPQPELVALQDALGHVSDLGLPARLGLAAEPLGMDAALAAADAAWHALPPLLESLWTSSSSDTPPPDPPTPTPPPTPAP